MFSLVAETSTGCILGSSSLGKREVSPNEGGRNTAQQLVDTLKSGSCLDLHSQDQMIIFMALAKGKSQIKVDKITLHTETAIFVTEKLTKVKKHLKFQVNSYFDN